MRLTKTDIVDAIHNNLGHSKTQSAELVESMLEIMKRTLANGKDVLIRIFLGQSEFLQNRGRRDRARKDLNEVISKASCVAKDEVGAHDMSCLKLAIGASPEDEFFVQYCQ